jgi:hypothetical protein
MRLFSWVNLFAPRQAFTIWVIVLALIMIFAAWVASRWRQCLSLFEIPPLVVIVMVLFSTPVLFAMERGQYDPLSILIILVSIPLLKHNAKWAPYLAGAVLCLAPWVKIYPGLVFIGLIGLHRWRALAGFIICGLILLLTIDIGEIRGLLVSNAMHIQEADNLTRMTSGAVNPSNHPLSIALAGIWLGTKFSWVGLLPSKILAVVILFIPLLWVTYHIYRCPGRDKLIYPYLLWIVALATFIPPISNDYNLCFLPLAVLSVWDRKDPLLVHVALALLLIWWQPIKIAIGGKPLLVIKLMGLFAVSVCLVERAYEQSILFKNGRPPA